MLKKEKLEQLMAILGELTEEQKAILTEALNGPINEKELFERLGVDEGRFTEFMRALAAENEGAVMRQELSPDEMEAASGGEERDWLTDGCAATVEPGSWCGSNDKCHRWDVIYEHMPTSRSCRRCGLKKVIIERETGSKITYLCQNCGERESTLK